jgi:hypothetical protein
MSPCRNSSNHDGCEGSTILCCSTALSKHERASKASPARNLACLGARGGGGGIRPACHMHRNHLPQLLIAQSRDASSDHVPASCLAVQKVASGCHAACRSVGQCICCEQKCDPVHIPGVPQNNECEGNDYIHVNLSFGKPIARGHTQTRM